jgi:hypothetical protein
MPKQLYKIVQFHGGLNSNSDARDIAENELSEAVDVMVDELGKIRMMGGTAAQGTAARTNAITPGYGLFQFSHDRVDGHTVLAGANDPETGADYLAFSDSDTTGVVSIYSAEDTTWANPITGLTDNTSSTGQRKDVFYVVDGALRVCDSEFRNTHANKWYSYVDRTHFSGLTPGGTADTYDTWHLTNAEVAAPTAGLAGFLYGEGTATGTTNLQDTDFFIAAWDTQLDADLHIAVNKAEDKSLAISARLDASNVTVAAASDWNGDAFALYPDAGTGFNLSIASSSSGGTIPAGTYEFGSTFIYDAEPGDPAGKDQESEIFVLAGVVAVTSGQKWVGAQIFPTSPYDARITGGRIYTRIQNSGDEWQMIREISLKDGTRRDPSEEYGSWDYQISGGSNDATSIHLYHALETNKLLPITYNMNTGLNQNATTTTAKYKTAVIANRIAYIGNVQYDGINYGDAVFKSPVNKFDMFTSDRRLEASINDGDSIVKLESYADRLLIFKKNKLELLNISQEIEFLEDTFMHKGVSHSAATCKTDFGIAWVNRRGCYLYDGQKVTNLLEKGGRQIIKESHWASFTTDNSIIGYVPKKRQLIVLKDCTATSAGDIYLFDMVTQSWVKGDTKFTDSQIQTNFITDWNADLVNIHTSGTGTVEKWDDAGDDSTAFVIQTKDIDFGQPAQKKKIYKVYVTYTGVSSLSVNVDYQINGDNGWNGFSSGEPLTASSAQNEATLTLSSPVECYSFQLRFSGTGKTTFEINDATIVFRLKGIR